MGAAKSQPKAKATERTKDLLGLRKCPQLHVQLAPHHWGGQGAPLHTPGRSKLPAPSPGPPGIVPVSKARLRDPYPFWTRLKPQQEHKNSLPHFPLSFKVTKIMPILKVCLPGDLRSSDETRMLKPRTAEYYFYHFCTSCPMRNF